MKKSQNKNGIAIKIGVFAGLALIIGIATYITVPIFGSHANNEENGILEAENPKSLLEISEMQQMTGLTCNASNIGDEKVLTDTRNGYQYKIRKMEDGRCWMTENIHITNSSETGFDFFEDMSVDEKWKNPNLALAYDSDESLYGVYYNWFSATKGVCPNGFILPTINDWLSLAENNGLAHFNFVNSGFLNSDSLRVELQGIQGFLWSSTETGTPNVANAISVKDGTLLFIPVGVTSGLATRCVSEKTGPDEISEPVEENNESNESKQELEQPTQELHDNIQTQTEPSSSQETSSQTSEQESPKQTQ